MAVYKRFNGKKLTAKDKHWNKGTWYVEKEIGGNRIHQRIPEAQTKQDAELAERAIIQKIFNQKYGVTDNSVRLREFAEGTYLRYCEQNNANIGAKRLYIAKIARHFKNTLLSEVTPQRCRDAQAAFRAGSNSDSSVNRIMSTLSKMFTLACQEGLLERNPMQYVKTLKEPPARSRILTVEEKERLWAELESDILLSRLVTLALNLPLRRCQLLAISPDAIDLQNGLLFATESKGRPPRVVPLNSIAASTLKAMIESGQLPFPLKDFRKRWYPALIRAGINKPGGTREENYHFHDLRKETASELLRNGVNPSIIQRLYAHSSMAITDIYVHADIDQLRGAMNTLDRPAQESDILH